MVAEAKDPSEQPDDDRTTSANTAQPNRINRLRRLSWIFACSSAIIASLLTFPSAIPLMIGGWFLWHTNSVCHKRAGWIPLASCGAIIFVKRVGWPPSMVLLLIVMAIVALARGRYCTPQGGGIKRTTNLVCLLLLWVTWLGFTIDWFLATRTGRTPILSSSRPVVCLGDSLTAFGYPMRLEELVSIPVIDLGENGITTADGVKQLPQLVDANPQVVVIELGGHDFLKGHTRAETKENLKKIIESSREIGAEVVLMEIPRGFVTDRFDGLERELAREMDLTLIPDTAIRKLVLWSPYAPPGMWFSPAWHLSDDGLHPNKLGNQHLAESVVDALESLYGTKVTSKTQGIQQ